MNNNQIQLTHRHVMAKGRLNCTMCADSKACYRWAYPKGSTGKVHRGYKTYS